MPTLNDIFIAIGPSLKLIHLNKHYCMLNFEIEKFTSLRSWLRYPNTIKIAEKSASINYMYFKVKPESDMCTVILCLCFCINFMFYVLSYFTWNNIWCIFNTLNAISY
jgi:hypothetical protein